ncbi:MAG: hypothetical protein ACE5FY_06950 [Nitrospiria bacterium]
MSGKEASWRDEIKVLEKSIYHRISVLLAAVHLFLAGLLPVQMERHLTVHGSDRSHAVQHTTLICRWVCTDSTFIYASFGRSEPCLSLSIEQAPLLNNLYAERTPCFISIRGPPRTA